VNCSTCFGPESDNCLSCSESTYLLEQICVDECPPQHYQFSAIHSCESTNFLIYFYFLLLFLFFIFWFYSLSQYENNKWNNHNK